MPWSRRRSLGAALAATVLLALAAPALDQALVEWLRPWGQEGGGRWWNWAAYWAGHGVVQIPFCVAWLAAGWAWRPPERWWGGAALAANLGSGAAAQIIKHLMGRPRPRMDLPALDLHGLSWDSGLHSFPSGHTATSFALAAVLAARFPRAGWAFYLGAVLVAAGRVVGGSHYLSDLLGGAVLGLLVGLPLAELGRRRAAAEARR
jgi:undecaprenyl-diphosphatase